MLNKCANPACSATFLRIGSGRLFVVEIEGDSQNGSGGSAREPQYSWLCNSCCQSMTVIAKRGKRIQVVPLPARKAAAQAALRIPLPDRIPFQIHDWF